MPQYDLAKSISYKQKELLQRLVNKRESFDAEWFGDLKAYPDNIAELSGKEASEYIEALIEADRPEGSSAGTQGAKTEKLDPKSPATENQISYIYNLLDQHEIVEDGVIVVDDFLGLLTTSTASHFIDTLKFTPRPAPADSA